MWRSAGAQKGSLNGCYTSAANQLPQPRRFHVHRQTVQNSNIHITMTSSNCHDCTFPQYILYWLLYYSWHWVLFMFYLHWWENSMEFGRPRNPERHTLDWLEERGFLRSQTDARRLIIFLLILLLLEPVEGYWILTASYQLLLPGWNMKVQDDNDWNGHFGKYVCMFSLPVGIFVFILAGITLIISTLVHLHELCIWKPKGQSSGLKGK